MCEKFVAKVTTIYRKKKNEDKKAQIYLEKLVIIHLLKGSQISAKRENSIVTIVPTKLYKADLL